MSQDASSFSMGQNVIHGLKIAATKLSKRLTVASAKKSRLQMYFEWGLKLRMIAPAIINWANTHDH